MDRDKTTGIFEEYRKLKEALHEKDMYIEALKENEEEKSWVYWKGKFDGAMEFWKIWNK